MARGRIGTKSNYPPLSPKERHERSGEFSPGGRLLQIEYARECPASGSLAVAFRVRSGIVLAKARGGRPELGHRIPHIWPVSPRVAYVACGNVGDMFYVRDVLAGRGARSSEAVARELRRILHDHAVRIDVRPLALQVLLGGADRGGPMIRGFDVTGAQFECDAWAFGAGDLGARDVLRRRWKQGLGANDAMALVRSIYRRRAFESRFVKKLS